MKLQGLFIASRAGRRIFWTLLLAAALPLLLFGAAVHRSFDDHIDALARRQQVQALKHIGLGLLDRLLAARAVLASASANPAASAIALRGSRRGQVLVEMAAIGSDGGYESGNRALWQRWQAALPGAGLQVGADGQAVLILGHHIALLRERSVPVALALRDSSGAGRWWLAEVDPDFLFGDLHDPGATTCVRDAQGRAIACDQNGGSAAAEEGSWRLFLRSDFSSDDWVLSQSPTAPLSLGAQSIVRSTLLGGVAALLVAALLGLGQVRRTMVPLERLIAGTRRLSQGQFDARVDVKQADEFGELAGSFNQMAERIGHQVQTLQVHASIDREILDGLDITRVLRHVAGRLAALVPGASVCVIEFDRELPLLARVHRAEGDVTVVAVPQDDTLRRADAHTVQADLPPGWLRRHLPGVPGAFLARPVRMGDQVAALLTLVLPAEQAQQAQVRGEIDALADRVAVALASVERERRLVERATRDELTGLANRLGLFEQVQSAMQSDARTPFSLMFIDLDRFKDVNDAYGHQTGDELLRALAQRLTSTAGDEVMVARPGGDEFVLVVPGPRAAADALAGRLRQEFARPLTVGGRALPVDCSIGLAHHPDHGTNALDLMRRADMAMYAAKNEGGCRSAWFEPAMDARQAERTELIADLRRALSRHEFELHYQPRVDAAAGEVRCAEALLRWRRGGGEMVQPARFVDLLEESTLIDEVGLWAIETACRQLADWRAQGMQLESVAVNVSTRQLHSPQFAQRVLTAVRVAGLAPSDLELEITESIFIGNSAEAIVPLRTLRGAGVGIALDDFGTGYSSLSYLHTLPISQLKVDRSFVAGLGQRPSALALTKTIVALAHALDITVVAEGVETSEQAELLRELGCAKLQGFLFSPPLPAPEFARFCAELPA